MVDNEAHCCAVNSSINVGVVSEIATEDKIDLTELGYDKLLGSGKISKSLHIIVKEASSRAVEKVEAAGGSVEMEKIES